MSAATATATATDDWVLLLFDSRNRLRCSSGPEGELVPSARGTAQQTPGMDGLQEPFTDSPAMPR